MNYNKILIEEFKRYNIFSHMVNDINKRIPTHIFRDAFDDNLSLKEHISRLEDSEKQHNVFLTTRISYDGVKFYFIKHLNKYLSEKTQNRIKVIEFKDSVIEDKESISFDVIFSIDGVEVPYELKVTQVKGSWTGATHATSKVPNYVLIMLSIDSLVKVEENVKFVNSGFMLIDEFGINDWDGKPSESSSYSTLKLKVNRNFDESIVIGYLKRNRVNYSVNCEKID